MTVDVRQRLEALLAEERATPGFAAYEQSLAEVLVMQQRESEAAPSAYWREELENFDYLLDASPLVIRKLRHHCFHVSGVRTYEYRTNAPSEPLERKLRDLLRAGGPDLLVPESPALGGFGFEIDGALFNLDTLKYFEALIALKLGGVLPASGGPADRRLVWEIGGGWGGFAYQFKTLFPHTTYVITDLPEMFLLSGTYLQTVFSDARVLFYDPAEPEALDDWAAYDFIFASYVDLAALTLPRVDLTVNMVSFQEMTTAQVREYVHKAHELEVPHLYSLNRDRSVYNSELTSVREIISERYWPRPIPVLPVSYPDLPASDDKLRRLVRGLLSSNSARLDYRHIVATRRAES